MVDGAPETFWQRVWATYRFRRNFGRERWWHSFWAQSGQPGAIDLTKIEKAITER
jgi:hypothetical protein